MRYFSSKADGITGVEQAKSCAVCVGGHLPKGWFRAELHKALNQQAKDPT
jgi:hypothetical protein